MLILFNGEVRIMSRHELRRGSSSTEVAEVEGSLSPVYPMISEGLNGPGNPRVCADSTAWAARVASTCSIFTSLYYSTLTIIDLHRSFTKLADGKNVFN